ncbi:hypothetical protein ACIA8O_02395 [Kitasatospora sp. NPDC051853]|uniref:hypothetical protein n=1 Tax=Kitasatospora sp. NPDC051853 TaxID=3364058 RepID=UPI0037AAB741
MDEHVFGCLLQEVRLRAGQPTYQQLADLGGPAKSTLSPVLNGNLRRPPDLDLVRGFLRACRKFAEQRGYVLPKELDDERLWRRRLTLLTAVLEDRERRPVRAGATWLTPWVRSDKAEGSQPSWSPSALLAEGSGQVPFVGRAEALGRLAEWRDTRSAGSCAVRLLVGPGGQGKSRLAGRLAELTAGDWSVWRARWRRPGQEGATELSTGPLGRRALVVVDYADRWPYHDLEGLLERLVTAKQGVLRVLLVARSDAFWHRHVHDFRELGYSTDEPDHLAGLPVGSGERADMFRAAHAAYGKALGAGVPLTVSAPARLTDDRFGSVLAVHMEALAAVYRQLNEDQDAGTDEAGLSAYLLDRERAHWEKLRTAGAVSVDAATMARAVLVATLVQGALPDEAVAALLAAGVAGSEREAREVLGDHAVAYPPEDDFTELAPLRPDRLGEDLVALTVPGHGRRGVSERAAANVCARLLARTGDGPGAPVPAWGRAVLEVLTAAALRWRHLATRQLAPLLAADPEVMGVAGSTALTNLARLAEVDSSVRLAVARALSSGSAETAPGRADLVWSVRDEILHSATTVHGLAAEHAWIAWQMREGGRDVQALGEIEECIALLRGLVADDPAALPPRFELGQALDRRGFLLERMGRRHESAAAAREAVAVLDALAGEAPTDDAVRTVLCRALANLAGRACPPEERLEAADRAVALGRALTGDDPAALGVELAGGLQNRAVTLAGLYRSEEALRDVREALEIRFEQARRDPVGHTRFLASAFDALGGVLKRAGDSAGALDSWTMAVHYWRELHTLDPRREHSATLVSTLHYLAVNCGTRQRRRALEYASEAARLCRGLYESEPEWYAPLYVYTLALSAFVDHESAREHVEAALEVRRRHPALEDEGSALLYATLLRFLVRGRRADGDRGGALATADELVPVARDLARVDPAAHRDGYLADLALRAELLTEAGDPAGSGRAGP